MYVRIHKGSIQLHNVQIHVYVIGMQFVMATNA